MELQVIREGSKGPLVLAWEEFLRDEGCYLTEADGFFDDATTVATATFQRKYGLGADGVVGNATWGRALQLGFRAIADDSDDVHGLNWPPPPSFGPTSYATREKVFGHIEFVPAGSSADPEAVKIVNGWVAENIVTVTVPQLSTIPGMIMGGHNVGHGPRDGKVQLHKRVVQPMLDLWQRWEDEGLLDLVLTWAGMWVPRFVRGSRTNLSNHAYGSAFDINAPWNGLQKTPARIDQTGSVRKLVPIANELGWYWLGHNTQRPDGMHFEYARA